MKYRERALAFACLCVLLFVLSFTRSGELPAQSGRGEVCLLWYNLENLYHPEDDSLSGDEEFTPGGARHWTWSRYRKKLTALAKVIIACGRGEPPELVALCEVENARVLEELVAHPILAPYGYIVLHRDSPDHRGMDVACLIRKDRMSVFHWEGITFAPPVKETRDILHLVLDAGTDTLDLFLVHLLSRYRGAGATADLRRAQAGQLVLLMDSVHRQRMQSRILVAGDFNDAFQAYAMEPLRTASLGGDSLMSLKPESALGSYKYKGRWSLIDQVLVPQAMSLAIRLDVFQLPPLLTEDAEYGGLKPFRSYEGFHYLGGISDHLPLVVDLDLSLFSAPAER
jgi:hypothetical protein